MRSRTSSETPKGNGFTADLRRTLHDFNKQTSAGHKRMVFLLIAVGAVLRALLLDRPITYDESFAYVQFATRSFSELITDLSHPSNHILYTLLMKASAWSFGLSKVTVRLPAFAAGVLALPLFYLFVRAMFNRYIALLALSLVVASGPLIEYSAMARGYSLSWFFLVAALVLGRHVIKENNMTSAVLIGVACALGMWAVTSMIHVSLLIYIWLLISITTKYDHTVRTRLFTLLVSVLTFLLVTTLFYYPVVQAHGFDQILHHNTIPFLTWKEFKLVHEAHALELWAYIVDSSATWLALIGVVGLLHAAFISSKYRVLAFAMLLGAVPLVLVQRMVGPPESWLYSLFLFHLSSAIALFYLLKFIQEKLVPNLGKRSRTILASMVLCAGFAVPGMRMAWERTAGMPEAERCIEYAATHLGAGDKIFAEHPWDAPIEFHLLAARMDPAMLYGTVEDSATIMIATATDPEQTVAGVLRHNGQVPERWPAPRMVQDWPKLKIFAAP